jgi:hypothetical protein
MTGARFAAKWAPRQTGCSMPVSSPNTAQTLAWRLARMVRLILPWAAIAALFAIAEAVLFWLS